MVQETTTTNPLAASMVPDAQTIGVGGTASYALNISGGTGTAAWTCAASPAPATAQNTTTGCSATSTDAGSYIVTAAVTKGTETVNAAASLTVTAVSTTPATVTIAAVNQGTGAGGIAGASAAGLPANVLAAGGQLDVVLNVERGTEVLERVDLLVGTTVVATQNLSAAAAAAEDGPAGQAIQLITLSFNSACYTDGTAGAACGTVDATAGTAVVMHANGPQAISAQLTVSGGAASLVASNAVTYNFANLSGFHVSTTLPTSSAASAATGLIWYGGPGSGGATINAVPVNYGTGTITQVTVTFGGAAPAGCGGAITDTTAPYSAAFTCTGTETAGAGITPAFTAVVGGNAYGPGGAPPIVNANHPFPVRIDVLGPATSPTFAANPRERQNGWINAAMVMTGLNGAVNPGNPPDGWLVPGAGDTGIGGATRQLRMDGTSPGTVNAALAAAPFTAPVLPAPSLSNNSYCAIASATDDLGNESPLPASGTACFANPTPTLFDVPTASTHLLFGVDTTAPTIAFSGGLGSNARLSGGAVGAEFQVTVTDVGTIGNSGMQSVGAVVGTVRIARPGGLSVTCLFGGAGCQPVSLNAAPPFPLVPTTVVAASTVVGYYFYDAVSRDAALNQSTSIQRVIAYDPAANVPALTTALYATPSSGGSVTFNANGSDNFDLRDIRYTLRYGVFAGVLEGELAYPTQVLNAIPAATDDPAAVTFVNTNVSVDFAIANFVRQVEAVTGNALLAAAGGLVKPDQVSGFQRDQVNTLPAGSPITTAIPAASVTTGVSYLAAVATQLADSWAITNAAVTLDISDGDTEDLEADLFGPTATFNSPFARVDFYVYVDLTADGASADDVLEQIGTTTTFTTVDDGSAQGRRHRYTLTWAPGTTSPVTGTGGATWDTGVKRIFAVGVNAAGDALVTPVNVAVTLAP